MIKGSDHLTMTEYIGPTRAKPFLLRPDIIENARSAHNPAASLAARAECSLAYVSEVK